jgi:hypothetical protein
MVMMSALVYGASGCLSSIIPSHSASDGTDGGTAGGGNQAPEQTGSSGTGNGNGNGGSGSDGGNGTDGGTSAAPATPDPNCIQAATPTLDGHHNAGAACLTCHDGNTAGATKFTAAGTVYDALTGGNAVSGATVELVDANGTKVSIATASTGAPGNWYTSAALVFPLKVRASKCPADRPMVSSVNAGGGNCATAGCHEARMQIHVP